MKRLLPSCLHTETVNYRKSDVSRDKKQDEFSKYTERATALSKRQHGEYSGRLMYGLWYGWSGCRPE